MAASCRTACDVFVRAAAPSQVQEQGGATIEKGPRYCADPLGHRTGNPPDPAAAATLVKTAEEARAAVSKVSRRLRRVAAQRGRRGRQCRGSPSDVCPLATGLQNQVLKKVALSRESLQAQVDLLRGAVTIAYPGGLPAHENIPGMIEGKEELEGAAVSGVLRRAWVWGLWRAWCSPALTRPMPCTCHGPMCASHKTGLTRRPPRFGGLARSSSVTRCVHARTFGAHEHPPRVPVGVEAMVLTSATIACADHRRSCGA